MLYSYENRLMVACLAAKRNDEILQRIHKIFDQKLDWSYILDIAQKTKIAPLLYTNLLELGYEDRLPAGISRKMRQTYHSNGLRNLLYYRELNNILISFKTVGIEAIVLKGAVLAEIIWKNVSLRHMWDIDLLVREKDLSGSEKKLFELGYVSCEHLYPKDSFKYNQHIPPFCNPRNGMIAELHTDLTYPKNRFLRMQETWERAWPIKLSGVNTHMLCPDDLVVHLSYIDHIVGKLRNLTDIAKIVKSYKSCINWEWIIKQAYERDFVGYIYYPLYFAKEILNADIREEILENLHARSRLTGIENNLLKQIIRRNILITDGASAIAPEQNIQRLLCQALLLNARIISKIIWLLKALFFVIPARSAWKSVPRPLVFLYPIYRISAIIWKLIFRTVRILSRLIWNRMRVQFSN